MRSKQAPKTADAPAAPAAKKAPEASVQGGDLDAKAIALPGGTDSCSPMGAAPLQDILGAGLGQLQLVQCSSAVQEPILVSHHLVSEFPLCMGGGVDLQEHVWYPTGLVRMLVDLLDSDTRAPSRCAEVLRCAVVLCTAAGSLALIAAGAFALTKLDDGFLEFMNEASAKVSSSCSCYCVTVMNQEVAKDKNDQLWLRLHTYGGGLGRQAAALESSTLL